MKNTLLVSFSFVTITFAFLLHEANLAVDAFDWYLEEQIVMTYVAACEKHKPAFICDVEAKEYLLDIRSKGL